MLFHKSTKEAPNLKYEFKLGGHINQKELNRCLIRAHSYEAIPSQIPAYKGLK